MTRVLVTGAHGQLGRAIVREFGRTDDVRAVGRSELDISDDPSVDALVSKIRPDLIVNCAAYNHVDGAERAPVDALRVNAFGPLALGRAAERAGAVFVHYGTDFVFDGTADRPYVEEDRPNPRGVYAASKLLGEWFALERPRAYVLRVASLFGEPGADESRRGSLGTIMDQIRRGVPVPVFVDRTVSPTYTADVARATRALVERRVAPGLYHCVNDGAARWETIAREVARLMGLPIETASLTLETAALVAPRPRYSALSPAGLARAGVVMTPWQDALARYLQTQGVNSQLPTSNSPPTPNE